jgi:hypothetical protein
MALLDLRTLAGVVLLWAACSKPSMGPFDVTPHIACPHTTVTVSWTASEDVVLYQQSPLPADKGMLCPSPPADAKRTPLPARKGTLPAPVDGDTRFTLCFARADPTVSRVVDVKVTDGSPIRMGGIASCGGNELRGAVTPTAEQAAAALPVAAVGNRTARALVVEHGPTSVPLAPEARSDAFKGQAYAGDWVVRAPLAAGETCDQALDAIASRLRLEFFFDCGGTGK